MSDVESTAHVVFTPSGRRGTFAIGTPILQCARELGVDIDSVCGGRGICGRCQILISEGHHAKHGIDSRPAHASPRGTPEDRFDARTGLAKGRRLSCHATLQGDLVVDVPPESQVHKQVVRKRAEVRDIDMDPSVRLYYVEVPAGDLNDPSSDADRVISALAEQWGLSGHQHIDFAVLPILNSTLSKDHGNITVAVHRDDGVIAIWPGFNDQAYGIAFDIGSTTIAGHLCDLSTGMVLASSGVMNPQIRFGEDLMSRVSYIMMNPGSEAELTAVVRDAVNDLTAEMVSDADVSSDKVLDMTIVANPIMHHLFLGIDPTPLGGAPFPLTVSASVGLRASQVGLTAANTNARVHVLPCIAGHVGADTAGVILSEEPHSRDEISLIVDVGTNAEIVLGNKDRLLAASSPTGPAFEGAQVSAGQRASPGAIERVRIDPVSLEPRFKVIGCEIWSDEVGFDEIGFDEAVEGMGVTGICGSGIIEVLGEMLLAGVMQPDGMIDGTMAQKSDRIQADGRTFRYVLYSGDIEIAVTQNDIRAIQLAKAALYAGCALLMDKLGISNVDRIVLAGAFGTHIDPTYALLLGMIPDCTPENVYSAGNAAGTGARIALLNRAARTNIDEIVKRIEKIETAVEPAFQEHFVNAMSIPHASAPFEKLERAIPHLRARRTTASSQNLARERRRRRAR